MRKTSFNTTKYLMLLSMLLITFLLAGTVTASKISILGWLKLPSSTIIFPLTYALSDIITEVYGYKAMRKMLWNSIICGFIFIFAVSALLSLPAPTDWSLHQEFSAVFKYTWLFTIIASIGMIAGSLLNCYILAKFKIIMHGKYFWFRSIIAASFGDLLHTLILYLIIFGLIQHLASNTLLKMIISAYCYRLLFAIAVALPANFVIILLKKAENLDVYDTNTNFNPFKMSTK